MTGRTASYDKFLQDRLFRMIDSLIFGYFQRREYSECMSTLIRQSAYLKQDITSTEQGEIIVHVNPTVHDKSLEEIVDAFWQYGRVDLPHEFMDFGNRLRQLSSDFSAMTACSGSYSENQQRLYGKKVRLRSYPDPSRGNKSNSSAFNVSFKPPASSAPPPPPMQCNEPLNLQRTQMMERPGLGAESEQQEEQHDSVGRRKATQPHKNRVLGFVEQIAHVANEHFDDWATTQKEPANLNTAPFDVNELTQLSGLDDPEELLLRTHDLYPGNGVTEGELAAMPEDQLFSLPLTQHEEREGAEGGAFSSGLALDVPLHDDVPMEAVLEDSVAAESESPPQEEMAVSSPAPSSIADPPASTLFTHRPRIPLINRKPSKEAREAVRGGSVGESPNLQLPSSPRERGSSVSLPPTFIQKPTSMDDLFGDEEKPGTSKEKEKEKEREKREKEKQRRMADMERERAKEREKRRKEKKDKDDRRKDDEDERKKRSHEEEERKKRREEEDERKKKGDDKKRNEDEERRRKVEEMKKQEEVRKRIVGEDQRRRDEDSRRREERRRDEDRRRDEERKREDDWRRKERERKAGEERAEKMRKKQSERNARPLPVGAMLNDCSTLDRIAAEMDVGRKEKEREEEAGDQEEAVVVRKTSTEKKVSRISNGVDTGRMGEILGTKHSAYVGMVLERAQGLREASAKYGNGGQKRHAVTDSDTSDAESIHKHPRKAESKKPKIEFGKINFLLDQLHKK